MENPEEKGISLQDRETLRIIRTETALSRFPVHRISKKGNVQIEIRNQATALFWEVTYNAKYGQPGPLAYKLDTLIVNRRVQEARKKGLPIPRLLRLGSLTEILHELGRTDGGDNIASVRKALLQNAFAAVNAKVRYETRDRTEKWAEIADTRYGVIFTGETLPDGTSADAVYLNLHDTYRAILEEALTRPLDYDYMRALPPAAQRFYEIVSYQIYGALHFQNERAKLRYSEYCMLSTATRYFTFDQVKKQMNKIHVHHRESGYLARVAYEQTTDDAGQPDWWMYYVPGPNAAREYNEFTGNSRAGAKVKARASREEGQRLRQQPLLFAASNLKTGEGEGVTDGATPDPAASDTAALVAELVAADLNRSVAERFAREKPAECRRQLDYLPFATVVKSRGAYLRSAIEQGFAAPDAFKDRQVAETAERKKREEVAATAARQGAQEARRLAVAGEVASLLAGARRSGEAAVCTAMERFEEHYRAEKARRVNTVKSPRLKQAMEDTWAGDEKRAEVFLTYFADTYTTAHGEPCPIPEVRDWLSRNPSSVWRRLFTG